MWDICIYVCAFWCKRGKQTRWEWFYICMTNNFAGDTEHVGGEFFHKSSKFCFFRYLQVLPCFKPCQFGKFVAWSLVYGSCVAKECRDTEGYSVKEVLWEPALTMGQSIAYAARSFFSVSIVKRNRRNFWSHWCENLYWVQTLNRFIWKVIGFTKKVYLNTVIKILMFYWCDVQNDFLSQIYEHNIS